VGNWNNCVKEARGEWIKFVFQDDMIAPSCLDALLAASARYGKPFAFCERDFIFEDGVPATVRDPYVENKLRIRSIYSAGPVISPEQVIRIAANDPFFQRVGEPTSTLIHKSVFREVGGFDEALIQLCDVEFWCRVMIHFGAVFVQESLAALRVHVETTTSLNQRDRAFRAQVLDALVIQYRIAFAANFKPLRDPKITGRSILSMRLEAAAYAWNAWKKARWASSAATGDLSASMLRDWREVRSRCAGLQILVWVGLLNGICRRVSRFGRRIVVPA
jgi:GT2 family glycosyltransferase